ncbi:SMI1/KNR4 family protein [Bacillus sonorensis]|uniref:SMI1/KNR4 family protein n=1 Tax=Bacillus sonorensis TaxID=119858 RepID=UPI00098A8839|nr:SMI1/KNR4 family protein [Bacillus sonorensis]
MKEFWMYEDDDPYTLKKVTEKDILKAEKKLGVILPKEYKELILQQNGGYINYNAFPTDRPTSWAKDHIEFDYLLGLGKKEGILESQYLIKEWGLPDNLILIHGDGHTWVALDYRDTKENPSVHYFDLELEEDFKLANSFGEFLSKLYTDESDDLEGIDVEDFKISYISPDDPEAITREEAESILNKNSDSELHKIAYYPIQSYEDLKWLLTKIKDNSIRANVDTGIELASALESIISYHESLTFENEETSVLVEEIVATLEKLDDSDVDILLSQIKDLF